VTEARGLELAGISRRFGSVLALDDASLLVRPGTVHALLGENGAGKTTLMRIAFGLIRPDRGTIRIGGRPITLGSPADAMRLGLGMVHQHFTLVPAMTVAENVALGGGRASGGWRFSARSAAERVLALGKETGLTLDPAARVESLSVASQQRVEIVKALVRDTSLLILDEPTAVLAPAEARDLLAWLRRFAGGGHAVVLITHRLRDALEVADEITVLRRGRVAWMGRAPAASERSLTEAMIGGALAPTPLPQARTVGGPVLKASEVRASDERGVERLHGVTLEVRAGEIVGVAGVEGAGQRELLRTLAGRAVLTAGSVERPPDVGFIPEDRQHDALVLDFPLYENVALRGAGVRRGVQRWQEVERRTAALIEAHDVRTPGPRARAGELSGGNQQKLVLARELDGAPSALIAENPTRGLDVRAAAAVHARLREARDRGAAVLVYSSDLEEVLDLADRVIVMFAGTAREVAREPDAVGRALLGGT
jgi:general nucleoside transport system ATP-binding protein